MPSVLRRNVVLVNGALTVVVAASAGLYINLLSNQLTDNSGKSHAIDHAVARLGWWNALWASVLGAVWIQAKFTRLPVRALQARRDEMIGTILEAACRSLIHPTSSRHIRAFVTLRLGKSGTRVTRYHYNGDGDPERTATYALTFGITGKAYQQRSVVAEELPAGHHADYDVNTQYGVLSGVRTVLAAPILNRSTASAEPLGVLAFDSTLRMDTLRFNEHTARAVAQQWADILADLLTIDDEVS